MKFKLDYLETIPLLFEETIRKNKDIVAFYEKKGGEWLGTTYKQARDTIEDIAMGLQKLGYQKGDRIGILSENCPEWIMTDFACAHFGFVSTPIYPTLTPKQIAYIIKNSGAKIIFVSNQEQAEKIIKIKQQLQPLQQLNSLQQLRSWQQLQQLNPLHQIKKMIIFDSNIHYPQEWIINFSELLDIGEKHKKKVSYTLEDEGKKRTKEDLWTLIYTSGTTGDPKGVMLTHFNLATNIQSTQSVTHFKPNRRWLSFLPLSHSLERAASQLNFWLGATIYFAESIEKIGENLKDARPHHIVSVPRIYEKIYAKILDSVSKSSPTKQKIFYWAKGIGSEVSKKYIQKNKKPKGMLNIKYQIAKKLVFNKITAALGGEFMFGISGGAPLPKIIGEFFAAAEIIILEGFGLTETTPITNATLLDNVKFGKVGPTIPDVTMKIAEDGEILFKGPNIMKGYYKNPKATKEVIDSEGWFHSGDIGLIDEEQCLQITDRKKNIIVTSSGKNIAPAYIEQQLSRSSLIDQIIVLGDNHNFLIAVIVPVREKIEELASIHHISYNSYKELLEKYTTYEVVENDLKNYQTDLAQYEQIKKFILIEKPFTIENGSLTPSMKIKRKVVEDKFINEINLLYE